jgi:hypothetical protein
MSRNIVDLLSTPLSKDHCVLSETIIHFHALCAPNGSKIMPLHTWNVCTDGLMTAPSCMASPVDILGCFLSTSLPLKMKTRHRSLNSSLETCSAALSAQRSRRLGSSHRQHHLQAHLLNHPLRPRMNTETLPQLGGMHRLRLKIQT